MKMRMKTNMCLLHGVPKDECSMCMADDVLSQIKRTPPTRSTQADSDERTAWGPDPELKRISEIYHEIGEKHFNSVDIPNFDYSLALALFRGGVQAGRAQILAEGIAGFVQPEHITSSTPFYVKSAEGARPTEYIPATLIIQEKE